MVSDKDPPDDDRALLEAWRGGDAGAGNELVRRYYHRVLRFFDLKAGFVAEDLTQRTFLGCLQAAGAFRGDSTFKAYLFGIARLQYMQHLRRAGRMEAQSQLDMSPLSLTSPSRKLARTQDQQILMMAMARLPEGQLAAVQLYYWEGMSTGDIGEALGIPASTVTSRLSRAREALRKHVLELAARPGVGERVVEGLDAQVRALRRVLGAPVTRAQAESLTPQP
jgi:RNA polymerase sigma factor (sigma-70 family)